MEHLLEDIVGFIEAKWGMRVAWIVAAALPILLIGGAVSWIGWSQK